MYSGKSDVDVVIIGAGIAGLTAAFAIHEHEPDLSILVLDGNDRIGGRILSVPLEVQNGTKYQFDLGGHFFRRSQRHLLSLIKKLKLSILENSTSSGYSIGDFNNDICVSNADPPIFGNSTEVDELVKFLKKGGAIQICEKIANIIGIDNVKINSAVTTIRRSEFATTVSTPEEEFRCRYVILAVPPKQLLQINFFPSLNDSRLTVLDEMRNMNVIKFVATYEKEFWTVDSYNGDIFCCATNLEKFPMIHCYSVSSEGKAALSGLLDLTHIDKKKSYKFEVLQQLAVYLGADALMPLDYKECHWYEDEYVFGGGFVGYPPTRVMKYFHEIRRPIGSLFFAGTETATYWYGHMDGAVQSGYRAAIELLYEVRPQALTIQDFIDLKPSRHEVMRYANQEFNYRDRILMIFMTTVVVYLSVKIIITAYAMSKKIFPL